MARVPSALKHVGLRRLFVSDEDVSAAERLLLKIAGSVDPAYQQPASGDAPASERLGSLEQARAALALRQRRIRVLGASFSAEPPFTLLLVLFANDDGEPAMTYSRVVQLGWVSSGTAARWLDRLVAQGWIERSDDSMDHRKTLLSLSPRARDAMQELFSWGGSGSN